LSEREGIWRSRCKWSCCRRSYIHDVINELRLENDWTISFVLKYSKSLRISSPERYSNVEKKNFIEEIQMTYSYLDNIDKNLTLFRSCLQSFCWTIINTFFLWALLKIFLISWCSTSETPPQEKIWGKTDSLFRTIKKSAQYIVFLVTNEDISLRKLHSKFVSSSQKIKQKAWVFLKR
jgi:hypothetical protein